MSDTVLFDTPPPSDVREGARAGLGLGEEPDPGSMVAKYAGLELMDGLLTVGRGAAVGRILEGGFTGVVGNRVAVAVGVELATSVCELVS